MVITETEREKLKLKVYNLLKSDYDKYDINAKIDSSLSYDENLNIILDDIQPIVEPKLLTKSEIKSIKDIESNISVSKDTNILVNLFKHGSCVAIAGNRGEAKTSLSLSLILDIKRDYPNLNIAVMGLEPSLNVTLETIGITILESKMDLLDLRLKNTLIMVDEFALIFDTDSRNKQLDKLMRFIDRIEHLNDKLIIGTAREGFYNKFMCSRINAFIVKQIEYASLVNGTWLKERVLAIRSNSDYRLECDKDTYYVVSANMLTTKHNFSYNSELDTKKGNPDLFPDKKAEIKGE